MDAVNTLLFWVVSFAAGMFLIFEYLNSLDETRKACLESDQTRSANSDSEIKEATNHDQEEDEQSNAEKQLVFEINFTNKVFDEITAPAKEEEITQEITEEITEEEEENLVNTSSDESSGVLEVTGGKRDDDTIYSYDNDDDWEGIERTELEKIFGEAVVFVSSKKNSDQINEDVKLQLYALQKIALQGPCHGSQPMAFKVSARAKWNAWQKLGDMSREMAMEKYVSLLVKAIPGWNVRQFC
ncbi:hypothetical protein ABFS83_08G055900 [Erythranthe nasuta]